MQRPTASDKSLPVDAPSVALALGRSTAEILLLRACVKFDPIAAGKPPMGFQFETARRGQGKHVRRNPPLFQEPS